VVPRLRGLCAVGQRGLCAVGQRGYVAALPPPCEVSERSLVRIWVLQWHACVQ